MSDTFSDLTEALLAFAEARDWQKFHSPKNLVMALSGEVGELISHFQWLTEDESADFADPEARSEVSSELADVTMYLLLLARSLGVDLESAVLEKLRANEERYPSDKARGTATKYTKLSGGQ